MRKSFLLLPALMALAVSSASAQGEPTPYIEVTGSATLNIVPDRITVEIGLEEYYEHNVSGDSTLVSLREIERDIRRTLLNAGVTDNSITVSDLGNYRDYRMGDRFRMAKRLTALLTDFAQLDDISQRLDGKGITSFQITALDNADIDSYNRQGLKSALDAARLKATFIAETEGLTLTTPLEIVETTQERSAPAIFSNAFIDSGSGMDNMRRIVRRYSVRVRYLFSPSH